MQSSSVVRRLTDRASSKRADSFRRMLESDSVKPEVTWLERRTNHRRIERRPVNRYARRRIMPRGTLAFEPLAELGQLLVGPGERLICTVHQINPQIENRDGTSDHQAHACLTLPTNVYRCLTRIRHTCLH